MVVVYGGGVAGLGEWAETAGMVDNRRYRQP